MGSTANSVALFGIYTYQSTIPDATSAGDEDYGFLVRVQPEVLLLEINGTVNSVPDAELVTKLPLYARTGAGKNRFGITTRAVIIKRLVGTSPLQFYLKRTIPWLQNNLEATLAESSPPAIEYQGQTDWLLVNIREEKVGDG